VDAPAVLARRVPGWREVYAARGWRMSPTVDRVYDNALARRELGWAPVVGFAEAVRRLAAGEDWRSALARAVGAKGYAGSSDVYAVTGGGPSPGAARSTT
jgi:UDP-glucose 4-epimerase